MMPPSSGVLANDKNTPKERIVAAFDKVGKLFLGPLRYINKYV